MEIFVRRFLKASLLWLGTGVLIGFSMAWWPFQALVYRPAHVHANLLGFVSMMIFGVAYHVVPRFTGNPLYSRRLPVLHLWAANLGLAGLVAGWITRITSAAVGNVLIQFGAALSSIGAALFIFNIWLTLDGRPLTLDGRPVGITRSQARRGSQST